MLFVNKQVNLHQINQKKYIKIIQKQLNQDQQLMSSKLQYLLFWVVREKSDDIS